MPEKPQLIESLVRNGGRAIDCRASDIEEKEGRGNYVTGADKLSEKIILDLLAKACPGDVIMSEESDIDIEDPLEVERLWVIDPLDGTNNYVNQRSYSAVSVGYVESGVIMLGAVYDPFRDELFTARRGEGAYLNGKVISVSDVDSLAKGTIATDNSYYAEGTKRNLEMILKLPSTPWTQMRGCAVLAMCDVAAGKSDLYFHTFLKPWDNAASFLIAEEAGAKISNIVGERVNFLSEEVVMGNPELADEFISAQAN